MEDNNLQTKMDGLEKELEKVDYVLQNVLASKNQLEVNFLIKSKEYNQLLGENEKLREQNGELLQTLSDSDNK